MRLYSLHPKYLDTRGLLVLGREALPAKKDFQRAMSVLRERPQIPLVHQLFRNLFQKS